MDTNTGFRDAAVALFRESFEGRLEGQDYTWYVQGKEGVLDALASADARAASQSLSPGSPTLAAHALHLLYLLKWANVPQGRAAPEGDWESSWGKQTVDEVEWAALAVEIRERYELFVNWFAQNGDWSREDAFVSTLAVLPHVAYHLGAMRQILRILAETEL